MTARFISIPDSIRENARTNPQGRAFVCGAESRDWAAFDTQADRIAAALHALGIARGDKVAIVAATSIEYLEAIFGALRAGGCVVPLATSATAASLGAMIRDCHARVLFASASGCELLDAIEPPLADPFAGRRIAFDFAAPGWHTYAEWVATGERLRHDRTAPVITPADSFNIIYSSGTTSAPKGILHSHGMRATQAARRGFGFDADAVQLFATPLYSNTTLQPMLGTVAFGATAIVMPKFDALEYLRIAAAERVTHTMLVPVQFQRILAHPAFDRFDLSAFVSKLSTGAPFDPRLKGEVVTRWPGKMLEIYGMTEGGCTCLLDASAHPDKLHTVGRPGPDTELLIIDDAGAILPQGEIGEVVGRNPWMMEGYYGQPEMTAAFYWHDAAGRAFHRTGDIGRFDADGFLTLLDRKKDVIISGGFNIYSSDLEAVLRTHPDVLDCAVIGIPSERWGESPFAFVVPRDDAAIEAAALAGWLNERLGKTQRIAGLAFRAQLPRSTAGKLLRRELRAEHLAPPGRNSMNVTKGAR